MVGNIYRDTPLHCACYAGAMDLIEHVVLPSHVDLHAACKIENAFGETLLHAAATFGKSPLLIKLLLECGGVDVNIQGLDGHTPLHSACYHGHTQVRVRA